MMDKNKLFDLSGRTAIVFGANVVVVDREQQAAEEVAGRIPGKPLALAVDITDEKAVAAMAAQVKKHYGRIDILHNNAATKPADLARFFDPVEKFDMEVWNEVMRVNLDAMFMVAKHVGGMMAETGRGSIIQTASIYGVVAPDQRIYEGSEYMGHTINTPPVYSASKAGVIGLSQYLATYWAHRNVRVNSLTPGGIESGQNDTFKKKYGARIPLGRMGEASELIGALIFLASDASTYITGQNIIVDGGLTAW
jgi:NAD(P)-dependent dehydrogenase (short-subunit alcohol dehydrogenase family)